MRKKSTICKKLRKKNQLLNSLFLNFTYTHFSSSNSAISYLCVFVFSSCLCYLYYILFQFVYLNVHTKIIRPSAFSADAVLIRKLSAPFCSYCKDDNKGLRQTKSISLTEATGSFVKLVRHRLRFLAVCLGDRSCVKFTRLRR